MTRPISLEGAAFGYAGRPVLTDLTMCFDRGTTYAVTGPSGCGKSTLLFGIAGLIPILAGRLHVLRTDVTDLPDSARARMRAEHFGLVFQDALLDRSRPVIDIVTEPGLYRSRQADLRPTARALLDRLGVGHLEGRRPGQISGGQAQRIGVARALVTAPSIILADEPTGNLDDDAAQAVMTALLEHVRREVVVLLIATHDTRVTSLCDERVELG